MLRLQVAGHVRHRTEDHGGVVILDTVAGQWMALNPTAGVFWRSWEAGAGFDQGVTEVSSRHPEVPPESIRLHARQFVQELLTRGLITITPQESADGAAAVMAEPDAAAAGRGPGWHMVAAAWVFLVLASVLVNRSFRFSYALVRASRREWCHREPTLTRAERLVFAVSRAARLYPGRAACLEQSLAAVLMASTRRWRVDWCIGSARDPYRFHAWAEVAGQVVGGLDEPGAATSYVKVLVA
jgi:Transglutaminase-like superfamily/Coenzyme PQQ synthesis protein D (PqqD)